MKAERLEREFADRAVRLPGASLLLRPADAIDLISRAADEGVPIVGIDGVRSGGDSRLDHLADFSSQVADGHGCWQEADTFIRARKDDGLVFGLTLGDDPVEAV